MRREDFTAEAPGRLVDTIEGYLAFVPDPLPPPQLHLGSRSINLLSDADRALGELAGVGRMLPNPHLLISPFQRREALLSSRIEGTTTGLEQLLLFEARAADRHGALDASEVVNYIRAAEYGLTRLRELPISLRLIREVHRRLLQGVRGEDKRPGEFRHVQNRIGRPNDTMEQTRFVPPPVQPMEIALADLERYIHAPSELPFLVQLALIHYQFEAIHPVMDGNGRIGRLLMTLLLCDRGYLPQPLLYLSDYLERHSDAYRDHLLRISQAGTWLDWIDFFLLGITEQARDAVRRSEQLLQLREAYRGDLQASNASASLLRLVDLLFERPAVTIGDAATALAVTHRSARLSIQKLERIGIVTEVTGKERNRVYLATGVVDIVDVAPA